MSVVDLTFEESDARPSLSGDSSSDDMLQIVQDEMTMSGGESGSDVIVLSHEEGEPTPGRRARPPQGRSDRTAGRRVAEGRSDRGRRVPQESKERTPPRRRRSGDPASSPASRLPQDVGIAGRYPEDRRRSAGGATPDDPSADAGAGASVHTSSVSSYSAASSAGAWSCGECGLNNNVHSELFCAQCGAMRPTQCSQPDAGSRASDTTRSAGVGGLVDLCDVPQMCGHQTRSPHGDDVTASSSQQAYTGASGVPAVVAGPYDNADEYSSRPPRYQSDPHTRPGSRGISNARGGSRHSASGAVSERRTRRPSPHTRTPSTTPPSTPATAAPPRHPAPGSARLPAYRVRPPYIRSLNARQRAEIMAVLPLRLNLDNLPALATEHGKAVHLYEKRCSSGRFIYCTLQPELHLLAAARQDTAGEGGAAVFTRRQDATCTEFLLAGLRLAQTLGAQKIVTSQISYGTRRVPSRGSNAETSRGVGAQSGAGTPATRGGGEGMVDACTVQVQSCDPVGCRLASDPPLRTSGPQPTECQLTKQFPDFRGTPPMPYTVYRHPVWLPTDGCTVLGQKAAHVRSRHPHAPLVFSGVQERLRWVMAWYGVLAEYAVGGRDRTVDCGVDGLSLFQWRVCGPPPAPRLPAVLASLGVPPFKSLHFSHHRTVEQQDADPSHPLPDDSFARAPFCYTPHVLVRMPGRLVLHLYRRERLRGFLRLLVSLCPHSSVTVLTEGLRPLAVKELGVAVKAYMQDPQSHQALLQVESAAGMQDLERLFMGEYLASHGILRVHHFKLNHQLFDRVWLVHRVLCDGWKASLGHPLRSHRGERVRKWTEEKVRRTHERELQESSSSSSSSSSKGKTLTETWVAMLAQIPQISLSTAQAVAREYRTIHWMMMGLAQADDPETMLSDVRIGRRRLGPSNAKRIARYMMSSFEELAKDRV